MNYNTRWYLVGIMVITMVSVVVGAVAAEDRLYPIAVGGKWGFIDPTGRMVIEPQFESLASFTEGLAMVQVNGKFGFIDPTGRMVIEPQLAYAYSFSEGLARVRVYDKWGFIDLTGRIVIEPQFADADSFSEGLAGVQVNGKEGFIDLTGHLVIEPQFSNADSFSEGLARVQVKNGIWGFIDLTGRLVIEPQFTWADSFSEGLARVRVYDKWGFIDLTGRLVIEPQFADADSFSEGLAGVQVNGKGGFIDLTGRLVFEPQFDEIGWFSEGFATVRVNSKWGFIDPTGRLVIEPQFTRNGPFTGGLAYVWDNGKSGYIDATGAIVAMSQMLYGAAVVVNGAGDVLYCSDPAVAKRIAEEQRRTSVAQEELDTARSTIQSITSANELYVMGYKSEATNPQIALTAYQEIINRFPSSDAAIKAIDRIEVLRSTKIPATSAPTPMSAQSELSRNEAATIISQYRNLPETIVYKLPIGEAPVCDAFKESVEWLESMKYISVTPRRKETMFSCATVRIILTEKGKAIFTNIQDNAYTIETCKKVFDGVTGIATQGDGTVIVEYIWKYEKLTSPTDQTLVEGLLDIYDLNTSEVHQGSVIMRKYDDGWRIAQ